MSQCLAIHKSKIESLDVWKKITREKESSETLSVFLPLGKEEIEKLINAIQENKTFKERYGENGVESDSEWQQIVFYGLIVKGKKFFTYTRGTPEKNKGFGDKRIAGKIAVGVGGHIEPFDTNFTDSLYREIDEEVVFVKDNTRLDFRNGSKDVDISLLSKIISVEIKGVIKNDSDDIGKVHFGIFYVARILDDSIDVEIKDDYENEFGSLVDTEEYIALTERGGTPESWTALVMESNFFKSEIIG
ncbi:MAG: hypothetical protein AB1333_04025 [Patescibacteria group bacterium]